MVVTGRVSEKLSHIRYRKIKLENQLNQNVDFDSEVFLKCTRISDPYRK